MAGLDDTASLAAAEAQVSRDAARRLDIAFRGGAGIFSILVLLIAWEIFARSGKVTAFMLPPFSAVAERIYADAIGGELWRNLWVTMFRRYRARRGDGAQPDRSLVLRSDHIGRISDAEDRVPADHHSLARAL